ncbi:MAG: acyl carrier protein [Myxococcales bacterium]|nr:acyl carrier protein [Myxococcales bacterium]
MNSIEERLRAIIVALGEGIPPDFELTAHVFRDLGIESTKAIELLFEIEDQFEVALPDLEYNDCEHLGDLVALLTKLVE